MPGLNTLSIGRKLGLSAVVALLMLGAMYWSVAHGLTALAADQSRTMRVQETARDVDRALLLAAEGRTLGQELRHEQVPALLLRALHRIVSLGERTRTILRRAQAAEGGSMTGTLLAAANGSLSHFVAALAQEAALRRRLLTGRARDLIEARPTFEASLDAFAQELAQGGVVASGVDAVTGQNATVLPPEVLTTARGRFTAYRLAMARMQNAALLFLATGNRAAANATDDATAQAKAALAALLASGIPAGTQQDARTMGMLGGGIAKAAAAAVRRTLTLDRFVAGPVALADRAMTAALRQVGARLDRQARAQVLAAAREQGRVRARLLAIACGIALVLGLSGWLTARTIGRPIRAMTRTVQAMAGGDTAVAIGYAGRGDEIGRMAAALEVLRGVAHDAFVKAEMIRQFPTGLMLADPADDYRITYLNPEAERLLGLVRGHLPVPPEELIGKSIDIFHPAPERQRALLADPANLPHHARVAIGEETFDLNISAIRDQAGGYVGPMVTWHRMTGQVRLVQRFERTVGAIARGVGERAGAMQGTAEALTGTADDAGRRITAVAGASDQAAANVAAVATSAEELAASVGEISRQVAESARIAGQAVAEANATDRCVAGLAEAAGRIGEVVRLIGDIAGSTNLLALNATIEAARAGEAGKGFAVVASEVKALATQTARATEEIGSQIAAMQGATGQAVEALRSIGATIQRMNEIATAIAGAVEEQGAATQEIARAVQHAAAGTTEVTRNIGHVAEAVTRTNADAAAVLAAAGELSRQSDTLKAEAEGFVAAIRSAA